LKGVDAGETGLAALRRRRLETRGESALRLAR
jgi:hypothetical protein